VDVWLENGEFVMAVEVKSRPRKRDVEDHVKRMGILRAYLDGRNDTRKLLGAIAGAIVSRDLRDTIIEQGFYVIEQSGDTVKIEPPTDFKPRIW
jgi:ACT domain-containing protein